MASIHTIFSRRIWLPAVLTVLLASGMLTLAPARAAPPDLKLDLYIKGDSDNVVPPGSVIELGARISFSGPNTAIETDGGFLRLAPPYEWEDAAGRARLILNAQDFSLSETDKGAWAAESLEADAVFGGQSLLVQDFLIVSTHPVTSARTEEREGRIYVFDLAAKSLVTTIGPDDASGSEPVGFGRAIAFYQDGENNQIGYLFIGSPNNDVSSVGGDVTCGFDTAADPRRTACAVGQVYIFKIDKAASGDARKELIKTLTTTKMSGVVASSDNAVNRGARFGYSLAVTPSGDVLVAGTPGLHLSGGAVLIHRPNGGWGDAIFYNGVKLTPYQVTDDRPSLMDRDDTNSVDALGKIHFRNGNSFRIVTRTGNVNVAKAWDGAELGASVAIDSGAEHVVLGAPRKSRDLDASHRLTAVNIKGSTCDGMTCTDPLPTDSATRSDITASTTRYFGEVLLFQRQRDAAGALVRSWRTGGALSGPGNPHRWTQTGSGLPTDDMPNIGKPTIILRDRDLLGRGAVRDEELLGFSVAISADGQTVAASAPQSPKSLRRAEVTGTNAESGVGSVYIWRRAPHTAADKFDGWWTNRNTRRRASTVNNGVYGNSDRFAVDHTAAAAIRPSDDGAPGSDRGGQFGFGPLSFSSAGDLYISHSRLHDEADTAGSTFHGQGWVIPAAAFSNLPTGQTDAPTEYLMDDASAAAAVAGIRIAPPAPADNGFFGAGGFGIPVDSMDPSPLVVGQPQFSATYSRMGVGSGRVWVFSSKTVDDALGHPPLIDGPVLIPVLVRSQFGCEPSDGMAADDDEDATFVCELDLSNLSASNATDARAEIDIRVGWPDGTFKISGSFDVDGRTITDTLEVRVGKVDEVAEVNLAAGTDAEGKSLPTQLTKRGPSSSTMLVLSILNENGTASAPDSTESVLFTTNLGKLSSTFGAGDGRCSGRLICQLDVSRLNADNSHKIPLTVSHPGTPGSGNVEATVLSSDGEVFRASVPLAFAGDAKTLSISEPATALNNRITIESGEDAENDGVGDGDDNTDTLTLVVSAADESGIAVGVPHRSPRAVITGPNGVNVAETVISTNWTVDNDSETEGDQFAENSSGAATVTLTVVSSTPLTAGEYTLALRTAGIEAEQRFNVAGPPAAIALSEPEGSLRLGSRLTFTATVSDASGVAVADGTAVEFQGAAVGGEAALLTLISQSGTSKGGEASASWLVLDAGQAFVSASAGGITEIQAFRVGTAPLFSASDTLSSTAPGGFASYLADTPTTASALLAELEGVNSILLWSGVWARYSVNEAGLVIPGSADFPITQGSVLYLGG